MTSYDMMFMHYENENKKNYENQYMEINTMFTDGNADNLTCQLEFNIRAADAGKILDHLAEFLKSREEKNLTVMQINADNEVAEILAEKIVNNRADGHSYTQSFSNVLFPDKIRYKSWHYNLPSQNVSKVILRGTPETFEIITGTRFDSDACNEQNAYGQVTDTKEMPLPTRESDRQSNGTVLYFKGYEELNPDEQDMSLSLNTNSGPVTIHDLKGEVRPVETPAWPSPEQREELISARAKELFLRSSPATTQSASQLADNLIDNLKKAYAEATNTVNGVIETRNARLRGDNIIIVTISTTKPIAQSQEFKNFVEKVGKSNTTSTMKPTV